MPDWKSGKARLAMAAGWTTLMFAASSIRVMPREAVPLLTYDKLLHIVEYGVFAWLWGDVLRMSGVEAVRRYAALILVLCGALWGGLDELYQGTRGRSRDINDLYADVVGVCAAQLIQQRAVSRRKAG